MIVPCRHHNTVGSRWGQSGNIPRRGNAICADDPRPPSMDTCVRIQVDGVIEESETGRIYPCDQCPCLPCFRRQIIGRWWGNTLRSSDEIGAICTLTSCAPRRYLEAICGGLSQSIDGVVLCDSGGYHGKEIGATGSGTIIDGVVHDKCHWGWIGPIDSDSCLTGAYYGQMRRRTGDRILGGRSYLSEGTGTRLGPRCYCNTISGSRCKT